MKNLTDEVFLTKGVLRWPIELAEEILAKLLTYEVIYELAMSVNGYDRHHNDGAAWASPIVENIGMGGSCEKISTQDLLDIVFLYCRGERFCDGLIRSVEPQLRTMIEEVVQRVHSTTPPIFIPQELDQTDKQ